MWTGGKFVGEAYDTGGSSESVGSAAAELALQGRSVRHLGCLLAPEDELALHLFEADTAETVAEVGRRAATPFDRVWRAVWTESARPCVQPPPEEAT